MRSVMRADGADIVDVGGESTRPGASSRVDPETESDRVLPVLRELALAGVPTSASIRPGPRWPRRRRAAGRAGRRQRRLRRARGIRGWPRLLAAAGVPWVLMHWRGHSRPDAGSRALQRRRRRGPDEAARSARTRPSRPASIAQGDHLWISGLGFAKQSGAQLRGCALHPRRPHVAGLSGAHRRQPEVVPWCAPGQSRRRSPRPVAQRGAATVATSVLAVEAGVWGVRVHDVCVGTVDALRVLRGETRDVAIDDRHHLCLTGLPGSWPTRGVYDFPSGPKGTGLRHRCRVLEVDLAAAARSG